MRERGGATWREDGEAQIVPFRTGGCRVKGGTEGDDQFDGHGIGWLRNHLGQQRVTGRIRGWKTARGQHRAGAAEELPPKRQRV